MGNVNARITKKESIFSTPFCDSGGEGDEDYWLQTLKVLCDFRGIHSHLTHIN